MSRRIGDFCYWVMMSTEPEASRAFYTALFGWTLQNEGAHQEDEAHQGYVGLDNGENHFGGIDVQRAPGVPSAWLGYIEVEDADAVVARIEALGGGVMVPPMNLGADADSGRIAITTDPQGAAFGVYAGGASHADWAPRKDQPGDFDWAEAATSDVEGAKAFYSELLGWTEAHVMETPTGGYHMMALGEKPVAGILPLPPGAPMSAWCFYIRVEDVEATVTTATELGATLLHGPVTMPGMVTFAVLQDPCGGVVGVAKSLAE